MERSTIYTLAALATAILGLSVAFGRAPNAAASRRVPSDANEVLETLAVAAGDPRSREVTELRRALERDPKNVRAAARLAELDIRLSRERSDPRYLGHAQAALEPWWVTPDAPEEILVLRATIEQSLHDFPSALRDLDRAVATRPDDVQAWLTRATVLTVRGRYVEARESCAKVVGLAPSVVAAVCRAQIDGVNGRAKEALDSLTPFTRTRLAYDMQSWVLGTLGELALRSGDRAAAKAYFDRVLALDPEDQYIRAAAADLALDTGAFDEAIALTKGREVNDGHLLRLALAEHRANSKDAEAHRAMLAARFDASRLRGDVVHRREESRYWLELGGDPARALSLAKDNWEVQKEPWDVRVLLEAARAARASADGDPARAWARSTHLEDPVIAELVK